LYFSDYLPNQTIQTPITMTSKTTTFYDPYLKGIGQIMLQEKSITGLLFLIGIFVNSPLLALGTLAGAVSGTLTAHLLKFDKGNINSGLYGFNAALIGISMLVFFQASFGIWIAIIAMSAFSAVAMNFFISRKIPVFTFPFIALVWIALYFFHDVVPLPPPAEEDLVGLMDQAGFNLSNFGFGFGEVIFQGSLISGILFFIAVFLSSPNSALYGLLGTFLAIILAGAFIDQMDAVQSGWFTFNAVLCAIVFSGEKRINGLWVLIAVFFSVIIESLMMKQGIIFLTFPFVAATWITLILRDRLFKKAKA